ncbi:MAG: class I SAM-dependent methyltransferase [Anaerolineae bacterium]|nr:class I SAM-dependent methyltransferase [Anaerolineae bacterium]MDQ7035757.1 class I SAM-dependent methyltransferase [Anaerolineae bacterium]
MVCPHCQGAERVFSNSWAQGELKQYYKKGASKSTQVLIDVLKENKIEGLSLLDIGGGIGAVQHGLITAGVNNTVDVDASAAYLQIAQAEAEKLGYADKASYIQGDFVQVAPEIESADIVTLDRVVCCYPDMQALVELSAQRAKQFYALVYPRDNILMKIGFHIFNFFAFKLSSNPFRTYIHPTQEVDAIVQSNGLKQIFHKKVGLWQVFVYKR